MLNESAVYESKQILDQSTQPCFHVILHVDSCIKSNSAAPLWKLHYLSLLILSLPPYNLPGSLSHRALQYSLTAPTKQLYLLPETFDKSLKNSSLVTDCIISQYWGVEPSFQTIPYERTVLSAPLTAGLAIGLALTSEKWWQCCDQKLWGP